MIETPARVLRTDGTTAWVVSAAPSSCGACGGKGCGSTVFNRLWQPGEPEYAVANPIHAQAGDAVVVGLEDGALMHAAMRVYLLPLVLVMAGAALGQSLAGEPAAILGGVTGLLLAALWLKRARSGAAGPVILRQGSTRCGHDGHDASA